MCNYIIKSGWKKSFYFCGIFASPDPVCVSIRKRFLHCLHCQIWPMITAPVSIRNCLLWHDGHVAQVSVFEIISLVYMAFLYLGNFKRWFFLVSIDWQATQKNEQAVTQTPDTPGGTRRLGYRLRKISMMTEKMTALVSDMSVGFLLGAVCLRMKRLEV